MPDALGLCLVAIIVGGFAAAYIVAGYAGEQQSATARQEEADLLAQTLAGVLGSVAGTSDEVAADLVKALGRHPRMRRLEWAAEDGSVRLTWPPAPSRVSSGARGLPPAEPPEAASGITIASAPIRGPDGRPAGTLRVETSSPAEGDYQATLVWGSGIAAGVTIAGFGLVHRRLRRHVRPVAAVERNLRDYASGIERELEALTLSDSLGGVARGWNLLIDRIAELQREQQEAQRAPRGQDVLARFECTAFRHVVDRLPFGVLCVGVDRSISYSNASAAALLGRAPDEMVGKPVSEAVEDPAVTQALAGLQARGGAGLSIDHTRGEGDQETTLRFRIRPISEQAAGGEAMITVEDIGQLREDQRARDNFLYHVTHELRTPLTSIQAYAETLTKPGFDDEQTRRECYNVIISETRRLSSLVENILSISQLEVGTARLDVGDVDLVRLMRQMVQDHLGAADEKHIDLTLTLAPKVPKIRGDKQRLSVLLTNLIGNAVKYTPERGEVRVKLEVTEHSLEISVSDTGIGIAPEDQPHVFDKFYRAADDTVQMITGTGLGLAIAREVARLHGGDIHLESQPGKGSKFTVVLPRSTTEHADPTEASVR